MGVYLIQPNSKPSFAHTQRWGLNRNHFMYTRLSNFWAFNEGGGNPIVDLKGQTDAVLFGALAEREHTGIRLNAGDGTSSFASIYGEGISIAANEDFCIFVKFKSTDDYGALLSLRSSTSGNPIVDITVGYDGVTTDVRKLVALIRDDAGSGILSLNSSTFVHDDKWRVAAYRRVGSTVSLWIDDVQKASGTSTTGSLTFTSDRQAFGLERAWEAVGWSTAENRYLDCSIDWAAIAKGTVTDAEIAEFGQNILSVYNKGFDLSIYGGTTVVASGRLSRYHNLNGLGGLGQQTFNPMG